MNPGDRVGRYRIVRPLGAGGMGVVYVAHDDALERDVALKVLPADLTRDPERRGRLLREARAAAAVKHRSIAAIHEVGEHDEQVFVAMELITGSTLAEKIRQGPTGPREAASIGAEIARGLARAHDAGVVHRDLKPSNIMLDGDGEVKLLDFGLAKRTDSGGEQDATETALTAAGRVMGTPGYMAPEQAAGQPTGPAADLFALGAVVYELLTGRMAFGGPSTAERIAATLKDEPPAIEACDAPSELRALLSALLAKDPARRPESAADVAARFSAIAASTNDVAVASLHGPGLRARRATRWVASGLAMLAAIGTGAFLLHGHCRSSPGTEPSRSAAQLLDGDKAKLGCPVFEVRGLEGASGRVGAAASSEACDTVEEWQGMPGTTRIPAQLLGIAPLGSTETPSAPYLAAGVRETTLTAARKLDAVLDGTVEVDVATMHVSVRLLDSAGAVVARGAASGKHLRVAAREAALALLASIPSRALDPEIAALVGCRDGSGLATIKLHSEAIGAGVDVGQHCEALATLSPVLAAEQAEHCGRHERDGEGLPSWPERLKVALAEMPPDDQALWRLALVDERTSTEQAARRREQVDVLLRRAKAPLVVAVLNGLRASYAMLSGDIVTARTSHDQALEAMPRYCEVRALFPLIANKTGAPTLGRAATAWCPQLSDLWRSRARLELDRRAAADMQGTAYLLSGRAPDNAVLYAMHLLYVGRNEEVRALASRYLDSDEPTSQLAGIYIQGRYEYSQGLIGAAVARFRDALLHTVPTEQTRLPYNAIFDILVIESALGRSDVVDAVSEKLVSIDPYPEALRGMGASLARASLQASPPVRRRVLAKIRELLHDGRLLTLPGWLPAYLDGCEAIDRGDNAAAVKALRPLLNKDETMAIPTGPFDALGETDLAMKIDQGEIDWYGDVVMPAHARQAKRLAARGETEAARALAQRVIDAWGTADVAVPVVADMRAIVAKR